MYVPCTKKVHSCNRCTLTEYTYITVLYGKYTVYIGCFFLTEYMYTLYFMGCPLLSSDVRVYTHSTIKERYTSG